MKSSSRRTVSLIWSRLQASPAAAVSFPTSVQVRHVGVTTTTTTTTAPNETKPTITADTKVVSAAAPASRGGTRTVPFSTAMLEQSDEDDDYDHNDDDNEPEVMIPRQAGSSPAFNKQNGATNLPPPNGLVRQEPHLTNNKPLLLKKCTCGYQDQKNVHDDHVNDPLPPPLPKPVYSVHKRVLPKNLIALSSPQGRRFLQESMATEMAESYWALMEQFVNQSDPAYCGVTTLLMTLNAMNVDPNTRWKGGWRFYGDEDVLLDRCCLNSERIRRIGITMEQFMILGTCHGMRIIMKRPEPQQQQQHATDPAATYNDDDDTQRFSLEDFRADIRQILDSRINTANAMLVTSFSRSALQQTGDGHFSPIAAYHEESDQVLVLDVARFKYAPYWVGVDELYQAMEPLDPHTQLPRGWYIMRPPPTQQYTNSYQMTNEDRRPAHLVPESHEQEACPVGRIKVQFCPAKKNG